MEETNETSIEMDLNELKNLKNAIYQSMELIGDINVIGYTRNELRKDTQRSLVQAYDNLFALNKYLEKRINSEVED